VVLGNSLPKAVQVQGLTMYGGASPTGTIDLKTGQLVVDGTVTPPAAIGAQIAAGYNPADPDNPWKGPGITSSNAAADAAWYAVGYARNGDLGELAWGTWFGREVTGDSILVRLTYNGDADLNGEVSTDDFDLWKQGFTHPETFPAKWLNGDLDYSGEVTTDDFDLWKQGYIGHYPPLGDGSGGGSVSGTLRVPEIAGGTGTVPEISSGTRSVPDTLATDAVLGGLGAAASQPAGGLALSPAADWQWLAAVDSLLAGQSTGPGTGGNRSADAVFGQIGTEALLKLTG
jgi:hypothetical protein